MHMMTHKEYFYLDVIVIIICLYSPDVNSQQWQWANHIASYESTGGTQGVCDNKGNFYITGEFEGDTCHFMTQTLIRKGNNSIFLAKYDKDGNELWVQQFDVDYFAPDYYDAIADIVVDDFGFLYITGKFYSRAKFGSDTLRSLDGDIFIAKFATDGNCSWAKKAGGYGEDGGSGLAIDSLRNVYVCGRIFSTSLFDTISVEPGEFLAKYDSNGNCIWVKKEVSSNDIGIPFIGITGMKIFQNNLFACAYENSSFFTVDTVSINHPGKFGVLLCCFNLEGTIKWLSEGISIGAGIGFTSQQMFLVMFILQVVFLIL